MAIERASEGRERGWVGWRGQVGADPQPCDRDLTCFDGRFGPVTSDHNCELLIPVTGGSAPHHLCLSSSSSSTTHHYLSSGCGGRQLSTTTSRHRVGSRPTTTTPPPLPSDNGNIDLELGRLASAIVTLLKDGGDRDPEILEQVFTSWSKIMLYLQKYLIKDVNRTLKITTQLRFFLKEYGTEDMAESISVLLRTAPNNQCTQGRRVLLCSMLQVPGNKSPDYV